jgi:hypothetical protein
MNNSTNMTAFMLIIVRSMKLLGTYRFMNNFSTNLTAFMLIVVRSMKLLTAKLCVVCLSGVIVINYEKIMCIFQLI